MRELGGRYVTQSGLPTVPGFMVEEERELEDTLRLVVDVYVDGMRAAYMCVCVCVCEIDLLKCTGDRSVSGTVMPLPSRRSAVRGASRRVW